MVASWFKGTSIPHWKANESVATINKLLKLFSRPHILNIWREQNKGADWLCKRAPLGGENFVATDVCPQGLYHTLVSDATGKLYVKGKKINKI